MEVEWDTTGQAGENILWVTVDPEDEIEESNEDNNVEDMTVKVTEKGEGGVKLSAEATRLRIRNANITTLSVTIENTGDYADSYSLSVKSLDTGWSVDFGDAYTVSLDSGESKTFTVTLAKNAGENVTTKTMSFEIYAQSTTDLSVFDSLTIRIDMEDEGEEGLPLPGFDTPVVVASVSMGALVAFFRRRGRN